MGNMKNYFMALKYLALLKMISCCNDIKKGFNTEPLYNEK